MRLVRARVKDAVRVPADIDELKKLGEELDRAVEEFDVRTLPPYEHLLVLTLNARSLPLSVSKSFWRMCVRSHCL
jgi:hypothetical protein